MNAADGSFVYGIDFGTSTSALMIGRPDGIVIGVKDPAAPFSGHSLPTSVGLTPRGQLVVGHAAEGVKAMRPVDHRSEFKMYFGSDEPVYLGDRSYLVHELTAEVLRFLRDCARKAVDGSPEAVVITIPASWASGNEELMKDAAVGAGFARETIHLVAEPVAALRHAFAEHRPERGRTFCVYDLGGGTFDIALARSMGNDFTLLGEPGGLPDVGGGRFDREILRWTCDQFPAEKAELFDGPTTNRAKLNKRILLLELCRKFKLRLSVVESHAEALYPLGDEIEAELTREELADLLRPLLNQTLTEADRTVAAAGLSWSDVDMILPVGGSSRLPMIGDMLFAHTGRPVLRLADPDLAVVNGAVLLAREVLKATQLPPGLDPNDPVARVLRAGLTDELVQKILRRT